MIFRGRSALHKMYPWVVYVLMQLELGATPQQPLWD